MKIHSDVLTRGQIAETLFDNTSHVDFLRFEQVGSRKRARGFTVTLQSDGSHGRTRRVNAGTSQRADRFDLPFAASYDDWGYFLAALFAVDPAMVCDYYDGVEDFNTKTNSGYKAVATS